MCALIIYYKPTYEGAKIFFKNPYAMTNCTIALSAFTKAPPMGLLYNH